MTEQKKQGAKGQKMGRHSRAPSNRMQDQRSARNKRLNIEANPWSVKGIIDYRRGHARLRTDACTKSAFRLEETKRMRIDAQRAACDQITLQGTGLSFSEKVLIAARPKTNLHDWRMARNAARKQAMAREKRTPR